MESIAISLPVPNSPLRRQIGVSLDGYPLSPISLSRSISAVSSHGPECCEEKTKKQLYRYIGFLRNELAAVQEELLTIKNNIHESTPQEHDALMEQKAIKEKELVALRKKIWRTETLIELIRKDD